MKVTFAVALNIAAKGCVIFDARDVAGSLIAVPPGELVAITLRLKVGRSAPVTALVEHFPLHASSFIRISFQCSPVPLLFIFRRWHARLLLLDMPAHKAPSSFKRATWLLRKVKNQSSVR